MIWIYDIDRLLGALWRPFDDFDDLTMMAPSGGTTVGVWWTVWVGCLFGWLLPLVGSFNCNGRLSDMTITNCTQSNVYHDTLTQ